MKNREDTLKNFCLIIDKLINSKYLLASSGIFDIISLIKSSKILSDVFNYFINSYDFQEGLTKAFYIEGDSKCFKMPTADCDVLAFAYVLLSEINNKNIQLVDILEFFEGGKNYDVAFSDFSQKVLVPFKTATLKVANEVISSHESGQEEQNSQSLKESNEFYTTEEQSKVYEVEDFSKTEDDADNFAHLRRLIDLDKLSIVQSKLSNDEKEELTYVLNIFESNVKGGDKEKIKLSYLAYYYAVRSFKKLNNNVKTITEILFKIDVL